MTISLGVILIPLTIVVTLVFGYYIPLFIALIFPVFSIHYATGPWQIGPGFDIALFLLLVSATTAYIRKTNIHNIILKDNNLYFSLFSISLLYYAIDMYIGFSGFNWNFIPDNNFALLFVVLLTSLLSNQNLTLKTSRYFRAMLLITILLFLLDFGVLRIFDLDSRLRLSLDEIWMDVEIGGKNWLYFLISTSVIVFLSRLIRGEIWKNDYTVTSSGMIFILIVSLLFHMFPFYLFFYGGIGGFKLYISLPLISAIVLSFLLGYRLDWAGAIITVVCAFIVILVAHGVDSFIPEVDGHKIIFVDRTNDEGYRLRSYVYLRLASPFSTIAALFWIALLGRALRLKVERDQNEIIAEPT